jgi:glyoxylase-like metal-dependent hydrolase (beta-lactamase superfamily II)
MKRIIFILLTSLLIGLNIAAQKTPAYEIYALKYATLASPTPISIWVLNGPDKDSVEIIFMFWLIKDNQGKKNILVDAGCSNDLKEAIDFGVYKFTRPDSILLQTRLKAADITDIIVTHPHWDHIDGINLFPNAHIWMQKEDYNYVVGEAWQKDGNHGGFAKRDILHLVDLNISGKLTLVNGDDKEIFPGIKVYTGSRHTYNSQYVLVQSGNDKIIIASDNIWVYYSLEKMLPAPSYGTFDAKGYVAAMQRMKTMASKIDFIIPGHDAKLFTKFPKLSADVIRIK